MVHPISEGPTSGESPANQTSVGEANPPQIDSQSLVAPTRTDASGELPVVRQQILGKALELLGDAGSASLAHFELVDQAKAALRTGDPQSAIMLLRHAADQIDWEGRDADHHYFLDFKGITDTLAEDKDTNLIGPFIDQFVERNLRIAQNKDGEVRDHRRVDVGKYATKMWISAAEIALKESSDQDPGVIERVGFYLESAESVLDQMPNDSVLGPQGTWCELLKVYARVGNYEKVKHRIPSIEGVPIATQWRDEIAAVVAERGDIEEALKILSQYPDEGKPFVVAKEMSCTAKALGKSGDANGLMQLLGYASYITAAETQIRSVSEILGKAAEGVAESKNVDIVREFAAESAVPDHVLTSFVSCLMDILAPVEQTWGYKKGPLEDPEVASKVLPFIRIGEDLEAMTLRVAQTLQREGNTEQAEEHFLRMAERDGQVGVLANLGLAQLSADTDQDRSLQYIENAISCAGDDPGLRSYIAAEVARLAAPRQNRLT